MALFGIVLTAVTGAFISSARSVRDQRLRTAATRLASDRLETLRSLSFEELDAPAQLASITPTVYGTAFTVATVVKLKVAATGLDAVAGSAKEIKEVTATVTWTVPGGSSRTVSQTTAIAADPRAALVEQAIGAITMFPSPATTDAGGQPLQDIDVAVTMAGFTAGTLVNLSWTNKGGTAGARTLTSTTGQTWQGTVAKEQILAIIGADGRGQMQFTASAGTLSAIYGLSLQRVVSIPPVVTGATIDRNPVTVAGAVGTRTCVAVNQCQNTTDVVFEVTTTGLDPAQDSVILQYQLYDGTSAEVPLAPVTGDSGRWRLTVRQRTAKIGAGTSRAFRFTAIRSADAATAGFTVLRDVTVT